MRFSINTKVGFLESTGQGLSELRENLRAKEQQMAALGARMLAPKSGGETGRRWRSSRRRSRRSTPRS